MSKRPEIVSSDPIYWSDTGFGPHAPIEELNSDEINQAPEDQKDLPSIKLISQITGDEFVRYLPQIDELRIAQIRRCHLLLAIDESQATENQLIVLLPQDVDAHLYHDLPEIELTPAQTEEALEGFGASHDETLNNRIARFRKQGCSVVLKSIAILDKDQAMTEFTPSQEQRIA